MDMKLTDIDRVNHLVSELADIKTLVAMAERAEPTSYQLFIEAPGDGGIRLSAEGASTSHSRGIDVSPAFLARLKSLALEELEARRQRVLEELARLGVETEA
jgi:hypothetical protein